MAAEANQENEQRRRAAIAAAGAAALVEVPREIREQVAIGDDQEVLRKEWEQQERARLAHEEVQTKRNLYEEVLPNVGPQRQLVEQFCYYLALLDPELGQQCASAWLQRETIPVPAGQVLATFANEDTLRREREAKERHDKEVSFHPSHLILSLSPRTHLTLICIQERELQERVLREWQEEQERKKREKEERKQAEKAMRELARRTRKLKKAKEREEAQQRAKQRREDAEQLYKMVLQLVQDAAQQAEVNRRRRETGKRLVRIVNETVEVRALVAAAAAALPFIDSQNNHKQTNKQMAMESAETRRFARHVVFELFEVTRKM